MNGSDSRENYCFASSGIIPIRTDPTDRSEMVTQILLGETAKVIEIRKRWVKIFCDLDHYTGWVNKNQIGFLTEDHYNEWVKNPKRIRSSHFNYFAKNEQGGVMIPVSAYIIMENTDEISLPTGHYKINAKPRVLRKSKLLDTALQFLGVPYLWGGRTDSGIDCSGYIQTVHLLHGYTIPRDSIDQFKFIEIKSDKLADAEEGDIIYFNTKGKQVDHVGFYLGNGVLLHASGNVRLNNIQYDRRKSCSYSFDKRLADHVYGIQSGSLLRRFAKPDYIK